MSRRHKAHKREAQIDTRLESLINTSCEDVERGRADLAVEKLRIAIEKYPTVYGIRFNLGVAYLKQSRFSNAIDILHPLYEEHPERRELLRLCALCYQELNDYATAQKFVKRLINLEPDNYELWLTLTTLAASSLQFTEAIAHAMKAMELQPGDPRSHLNLGSTLWGMAKNDEALYCYETVLKLDPNNLTAKSNIALLRQKRGELGIALEMLNECIEANQNKEPTHSELLFKKSFILLEQGDITEGWKCYEAGFFLKSKMGRNPSRRFTCPRWNGVPSDKTRLLVWKEQGLGDEIMFLNVVPDLLKRVPNLIIECDARLVTLLQRSFPTVTVRPQAYVGRELASPFNDFDSQVPVGSLQRFFRNQIKDFQEIKPYLVPNSKLVEDFQSRLREFSGRRRVGVCWRSGMVSALRGDFYIPLSEWGEVFSAPDVTFVNLQYGDSEHEIKQAEATFGIQIARWNDVDLKDDQERVAALIACLDCVVSVTTAVAALSSAVGTHLKLLSPRGWTMLGSEKNPFYPNSEFFTVPRGHPLREVLPQVASTLNK
jgi:tetratricopeptide (TPR) repeat protein